MKKLVLFLLPALLTSTLLASAAPGEVDSFCNLAIPQTVRVFDWTSWRTTYIRDNNLVFEAFHWDASQSIWQGYGSPQPFQQPADANKHWSVTLIQPGGTQQWIYILTSRSTPDIDYVYVFQDVSAHADAQGQHYGIHPCRAFAASSGMVGDWIHRVYHPA